MNWRGGFNEGDRRIERPGQSERRHSRRERVCVYARPGRHARSSEVVVAGRRVAATHPDNDIAQLLNDITATMRPWRGFSAAPGPLERGRALHQWCTDSSRAAPVGLNRHQRGCSAGSAADAANCQLTAYTCIIPAACASKAFVQAARRH